MKLAYWFPEDFYSPWSVSLGAANALQRLGHEVLACGVNPRAGVLDPGGYPSAADLATFDGIIVSGPEHLYQFLRTLYPEWNRIPVPKAGWLHETMRREDYGQLKVEPIRWLTGITFCPAVQDQEFGFRYLPFGVDMEMFRPTPELPRAFDVCFVGLMYEKRQRFTARAQTYLDEIDLKIATLKIPERAGESHRAKVQSYAGAYAEFLRRIKVFVNLPSLCPLVVTKVYETAASGACLVTPRLHGAASRNLDALGGKLLLYDENDPAELVRHVRSMLEDCSARERRSAQAIEEMRREHRIEFRLKVILESFE